jgi:signal transduction histidine kinase
MQEQAADEIAQLRGRVERLTACVREASELLDENEALKAQTILTHAVASTECGELGQ